MTMLRGPEAQVSLGALRHNLKTLRTLSGGKPVIAVVKAGAYGHGAVEVSRALEKSGVRLMAVAFLPEAVALREAGIRARILVLFDEGAPGLYFDNALTPVIHSKKAARLFSKEAKKRGAEIGVHIKVDTGMGRMGIAADEPAHEILEIASLQGLRLEGVLSHFSDVNPEDLGYLHLQLERFSALRKALARRGLKPFFHISSSASTLLAPAARMDGLRVGLLFYGGMPFRAAKNKKNPLWDFKPVMKVKSRLALVKRLKKGHPVSYDRTFVTVRDSLMAVIPVGYADGYLRAFSNRAEVLVRGQRAPVAGRVCMDLTVVDVTEIKGASEGDEVVMLGEGIGCDELARWAGTNSYEIMTSLGGGARRLYID